MVGGRRSRCAASTGGWPTSVEARAGRHLPPDGGQVSIGIRRWVVQELVTEAIIVHEAEAAGIIAPSRGLTPGQTVA